MIQRSFVQAKISKYIGQKWDRTLIFLYHIFFLVRIATDCNSHLFHPPTPLLLSLVLFLVKRKKVDRMSRLVIQFIWSLLIIDCTADCRFYYSYILKIITLLPYIILQLYTVKMPTGDSNTILVLFIIVNIKGKQKVKK